MEELIARTRFTEKDLFVLIHGYDTGWMVCPPSVTDWGPPTEKQVDKWRRRLVRRLEKDGLVDSEANPCKELLDVIDPLRLPGLIVANEHYPMGPDEDDPRTAAVYVLPDGRATLAARGAGFFGGWFLRQLHGEAEILEAVLALNGLGGSVSLTPQSVDRRIIIPSPNPDLDISNLALTGDTASVIKYAEQFGFDPSDFLDLSHWWLEGEGKAIARKVRGEAAARKLVTAEGLIASKVFDSVLSSKNDPPFTVKYATHDLRGLRILEEDGFTLGKIDGNFALGARSYCRISECWALSSTRPCRRIPLTGRAKSATLRSTTSSPRRSGSPAPCSWSTSIPQMAGPSPTRATTSPFGAMTRWSRKGGARH